MDLVQQDKLQATKSWGACIERTSVGRSLLACSLVFVPRFCASPLACNKRRTLLRCAGEGAGCPRLSGGVVARAPNADLGITSGGRQG